MELLEIRDSGVTVYATGYDVPNNSWDYAHSNYRYSSSKTNDSYTYDDDFHFGRMQYDYKVNTCYLPC
jgi:hypothetical protein